MKTEDFGSAVAHDHLVNSSRWSREVVHSRARQHVASLADEYLAVSTSRDRRLFEVFLLDGYVTTTLSSVDPEHFEAALLAKIRLGMLITLCDDLADHPRYRNPELLNRIYEMRMTGPTASMLVRPVDRGAYEFASRLFRGIGALVGGLPHGVELERFLDYDICYFYQANRFSELLSTQAAFVSLDEAREVQHHNMGMIAAGTIDLMASSPFSFVDLGRCREVFRLGQRVARIANVLATYEREMAEGDRTNELTIAAARGAVDDYGCSLVREQEQKLADIAANERGVTTFDVHIYAQALRRLHEMHMSMKGII